MTATMTRNAFPEVSDAIDPRTGERARWPIAPLVDHLVRTLGEFHHSDNPFGYCSATAEQATGIHRTSWQRYVKRGWITARQADEVATALGQYPSHFWPDYDTAGIDAAFYQAPAKARRRAKLKGRS